ncbi:hypothetical protein REIP_0683 [Rickettsia endosymbiont of Ixodes pacificus]|uniref:Uncharacterized protein n=1 Tax=Rickettsia rhipicephali (strain 3-7-female6-CWPP) TaxID=1105113 RepID=A0AAI8A9T3_RICR3|nr:hypothetical protein MCC_04550 [Rickettsia rhipicephali str. 3-7-female6-CWPP]KJW02671.1 hypothetical protein REIP_0683 [Rickettsia endosymbiont of Ixodes pacificus]
MIYRHSYKCKIKVYEVTTNFYSLNSSFARDLIIIKSFDAVIPIDGLTRLNNYDVGIQDKQQ